MIKLLGIVVLGLFLTSNAYSEVITFYNCASEQDNYVFNNKKYERYEIKFNLSKKTIENIIIFTDEYSNKKGEPKYIVWENKIDKVIDHFAIKEVVRPDGSVLLSTVYDLKLKVYEITDHGDNYRVSKRKCK